MKLTAAGGTKTGNLVLFWPEQLPADFEERFRAEPLEFVESLQGAGQLIWFPGEPNGDFSLAAFVNELVPDDLQSYCTLAQKIDGLQVAGTGWFGGLECLFREDPSFIDKHPRLCAPVLISAGTYFAEVFTTDVPDAVYEAWLLNQAGPAAMRLWSVQSWIASAGVVAFMVFVGCLFLATRPVMLTTLAGSLALLLFGWLLSRTTGFQRVQQARFAYQRTYPDYVLRLRS